MDRRHLDELIELEEHYWWHVAKRRLVLDLLKRRFPPPGLVVEGGVGAGGNLLACRRLGYDVAGFDLMQDAVSAVRGRGIEGVAAHDLQKPWPLPSGSASAVLLLDVVEHTDEPGEVLRQAAAVLRPGGGVIVTVPAGPWLMGPWDQALGHRRRYTAPLLCSHAAEAGLRAVWISHWNAFALPPAIIVRLLERFRGGRHSAEFPRVHPAVNSLLLLAARVEKMTMDWLPLPFGLSLVAVLQR